MVKVVREGSFVGVVARDGVGGDPGGAGVEGDLVRADNENAVRPGRSFRLSEKHEELQGHRRTVNRGNLDAGFSQANKKYEATYYWPFQLHGMMGPPCAVADVRGDKATIWTGTQGPFRTRDAIATMLEIPPKNVHLLYREGSGSYGRLECDDVAEDAALMSRAVGKPVRVQWMREDEHAWDPKGPSQYTTIRAGVDAQGKVIAWEFMDRSFPWTEAEGNPLLASSQIGLRATTPGFSNGAGGGGQIYTFENQKVVAAAIPWVQQDQWPLANQQSSRAGRFGARLCQRIHDG